MCRLGSGETGGLSELSFSLALSDVALATLKIQARLGVDKSELESANLLKKHLESCLENMSEPDTISQEAIPDSALRTILQETFASMGPICTTYTLGDLPVLKEIVYLLKNLTDSGTLSEDQASMLAKKIKRLEKFEEPPPYQPDLELSSD